MKLRDVMSNPVIRIRPEESVAVAARTLARYNIGALPVCGSDGRVCGLVTDRDIVTRCLAANRSPSTTRDMDFTLLSLSDDEIWYELRSSAETRTRYPYDFILRIGYKLHGHTVDVCWEVENPSDEVLPFQIGAHPAFYWPMLSDEAINEGVGAMERELSAEGILQAAYSQRAEGRLPAGRQALRLL